LFYVVKCDCCKHEKCKESISGHVAWQLTVEKCLNYPKNINLYLISIVNIQSPNLLHKQLTQLNFTMKEWVKGNMQIRRNKE
jgi:hypothetical protein